MHMQKQTACYLDVTRSSHCVSFNCAAGGLIGYIKKGSKQSLAAGLTFGSLMAACGVAMGATRLGGLPMWIAAGSAAGMSYLMGKRYAAGRKLMPSGIVAGTSLAMALLYAGALM
eukprot:evm.model.scf_661.2 EVM.evm.TU.scf_661.2   scf_661:3917-4261(-)